MKTVISKLIAVLVIFIPITLNAAPVIRGVVLFDDPPATYVQVLEFASIREGSVRYSIAVLPNGKEQEIPRAGIIGIVEYPPDSPSTVSDADADTATQKIQNLLQKYPQDRVKLSAALSKWQNALAFSRKNQKAAAQTTPSASGPILEIDGVKYRDAVLTSFTGEQVAITHSDGVATFPAAKLTAAQIAALNATNTSVRINPGEIAKAAAASTPATTASASSADPEIVRLKASVSAADAALKMLQAEETELHRKMEATPNRLKDGPEFAKMGRRSNELNNQRQQAQFRFEEIVQALRNAEGRANAQALAARIDAYRQASAIPANESDWAAVVKKWTDEVAAQTKITNAAQAASLRIFLKDGNTPESLRLGQVKDAEEKKLQIAQAALAEATKHANESANQMRAENQRKAGLEEDRARAEKYAEAKHAFKDLPINAEAFVSPPAVVDSSPSYAETIEFLSERFGMSIGFGETSRKLIVRYERDGITYAFDAKDMNPELTVVTGVDNTFGTKRITVVLECRNGQRKIEQFRISGNPSVISEIHFYAGNSIDADKLGKALSHLVGMLGAKKEAF